MRKRTLLLVAMTLLLDGAVPARADEFKPGYLQITQLEHETYDVLWKVPAIDEFTTLKVKPQFPDGTEALTEVRSTFSRGVTVQRWRIRVPEGLYGKAITFSQLSETRIDVLARLVRLDGTVQLERILPVNPRFVVTPSPGRLEVVTTYSLSGSNTSWPASITCCSCSHWCSWYRGPDDCSSPSRRSRRRTV